MTDQLPTNQTPKWISAIAILSVLLNVVMAVISIREQELHLLAPKFAVNGIFKADSISTLKSVVSIANVGTANATDVVVTTGRKTGRGLNGPFCGDTLRCFWLAFSRKLFLCHDKAGTFERGRFIML